MELMSTCLDRLLQRIKGPFPEDIVCKMCVSVSCWCPCRSLMVVGVVCHCELMSVFLPRMHQDTVRVSNSRVSLPERNLPPLLRIELVLHVTGDTHLQLLSLYGCKYCLHDSYSLA